MKIRSGVAFLLMLCLVIIAVGVGAYQGWSEERAQVEETCAGLEKMLSTRVESAYNLLSVARRHLPETDEQFIAIANARDVLEGNASLPEKARANALLAENADALLKTLSVLPSVQADSRDQMYVKSYLPQMLEDSEALAAGAAYNTAAAAFNRQLEESFSGMLARMLGVKPAEEFIP
jgi:hypothetical protein